jgi:hypothetical protein
METNCGVPEEKGTNLSNSAHDLGINACTSAEVGETAAAVEQLQQICRNPAAREQLCRRISSPMEIEQLEMLEAELRNQGILPGETEGSGTLSQHALHTASILRWRARRAGIRGNGLHFSVDLPQYLLTRAAELDEQLRRQNDSTERQDLGLFVHRSGSWAKAHPALPHLFAELDYLERFAAYLLGAFDESRNTYQQGLNLILRVLARKRSMNMTQTERKLRQKNTRSNPAEKITLPIDMLTFHQHLRGLSVSDGNQARR